MATVCSDGQEVRVLEYTREVSDRGYVVVKKEAGEGTVLTPKEVADYVAAFGQPASVSHVHVH